MRALFETLESREFLSASVVKHAVKPAPQPKHVAAKTTVHSAAAKATTTIAPKAWNDLAGNWTGTFSNNIGAAGVMSASFQNRQGASNTGTFNLAALVGQTGLLTTATPDAYGNVLVTIPMKGGTVSLVSGISGNGQTWTGRWCTRIGTVFVTGIFTMHRV